MTDPPRNPDGGEPRRGPSLARDVALLVLVGLVLGVTHNAYMLGAGPGRGLPWIKTERRVVKLQDLSPADPPAGTTAMDAAAAEVPTAGATPAPSRPAGATRSTPPKNPPSAKAAAPDTAASQAKPAEAPARPSGTPGAATGVKGTNGTGSAPASAGSTATAAPAADVPVIPESREPIEAGLDVVRRLYAAKAALFLDARSPEEFAQGHIAGAVNLPFDDVFRDPDLAAKIDDRGRPVVTYCDGGDCDLSRNLAFSIIDAGRRRVLVFDGGLPAWEQAGLPVAKGAQP